jgi:hypothetical protein
MIVERIAIQEFQQFAGRLEIAGLQPGLNIFSGGNEEGKSSIARAVRTVFIERHKVSTLKELRPRAKPSGNPLIEVDFTLGADSYALKKQFFKPRCELTGAGKSYREDEAEDFLAELMGFSYSAKGASRPEHAGVPGLLWVEQGTVQAVKGAAGNAASYLRDALAQLAGGSNAGGEDAVIAEVQRELFLLVTDKQRRPTGVMLEAINALNALTAQRTELLRQQEQYNADVAALAKAQETCDRLSQEKPWDAFERQIAEADSRVKAVAGMEQRIAQTQELMRSTSAELALLLEQETTAAREEASVVQQREAVVVADRALREAEVALGAAQRELQDAQTAKTRANAARDLANVAAVRERFIVEAGLHESRAQQLLDTVVAVDDLEHEIWTLKASTTPQDEQALEQLREAVAELAEVAALEKTGFSQVSYRLQTMVEEGGVPLAGTGVMPVDEARVFDIPQVGQLVVTPAIDQATLAANRVKAEKSCAAALAKLGVESLESVQAREAARAVALTRIAVLEKMVAFLAPEGREALSDAQSQAAGRLAETHRQIEALPDTSIAVSLEEASKLAAEAGDREADAGAKLTKAGQNRMTKAATAESLLAALREAEARLQAPEYVARRHARAETIVEKRAAVTGLAGQIDTVRREMETAKASELTAEIARLKTAAQASRASLRDAESQTITLRARLETVGASGLEERIAQVGAAVEQGERRVTELRLRADALTLLEKSLVDERDRAVEALRAPLTSRLTHYLKFLFGDSSLSLTEDLRPVALTRAQQVDELEGLSFGTQEQLGILVRLAYADLLKDAGRPTLVLLDDIAVFADPGRLEALKAAIRDAATRHQILLFTCKPQDWNDMGVDARSVEALKKAA